MSEEALEQADPIAVDDSPGETASSEKVGLSGLLEAEEGQAKAPVPEKYELNVHDSEDFDVEAYSAVAKELGLSQEAAQKIVDEVLPRMAQKQSERMRSQTTEFVDSLKEQVRKDTEIGGDNFKKSMRLAVNAVQEFGTPEFKAILDGGPIGVHPEMLRFLARVGKMMAEDEFVATGNTKPESGATLKDFYPNLKES